MQRQSFFARCACILMATALFAPVAAAHLYQAAQIV